MSDFTTRETMVSQHGRVRRALLGVGADLRTVGEWALADPSRIDRLDEWSLRMYSEPFAVEEAASSLNILVGLEVVRPFPQDRTRGSPMSDQSSRVVTVTEGPGTRLKELLASLGLVPDGCRCRERMQEMNNWGLDGCRRNREQIVAWLREEAGKRGWWAHVVAAWRAAREGLAFTLNPLDPAPGLLDEALRREEARSITPPEGGGP